MGLDLCIIQYAELTTAWCWLHERRFSLFLVVFACVVISRDMSAVFTNVNVARVAFVLIILWSVLFALSRHGRHPINFNGLVHTIHHHTVHRSVTSIRRSARGTLTKAHTPRHPLH